MRVIVYYDNSRNKNLEEGEINFHTIRVFRGSRRRDFNTLLSSLDFMLRNSLTSRKILKLFKKFTGKNHGGIFTRIVDRKKLEILIKYIFSINEESDNSIVFEERPKLEFI